MTIKPLTIDYQLQQKQTLENLYLRLTEREAIDQSNIKANMHIGVIGSSCIDVITVKETGPGRVESYGNSHFIAIAKMCPGDPAITWFSDGRVQLKELKQPDKGIYFREQLEKFESVFGQLDSPIKTQIRKEYFQDILGILWQYDRAVWVNLDLNRVVQLSKEEKRKIWQLTPYENLSDTNCDIITEQNAWFYLRRSF